MIKRVSDEKISYDIFLPNHDSDHLQRLIKNTSKPYELGMLKDMASRLNKESVVIDVGANIGNHSIYLASVVECRVICFEPDSKLCDAIKQSAEINGIENKIEIYNVAAGSENTICEIVKSKENPESVGSQQVVANSGTIDMRTIDSFNFNRADCMKIDVEGFETEVLLGSRKLIEKNLPIIYIEAWNKEYLSKIIDILSPLGYNIIERFNATPTYLFTTD